MDRGSKIFVNKSGVEGQVPRHEVLMNKVTTKLMLRPNGNMIRKVFYYVMDPARGQYIRISPRSLHNANIWQLLAN